VPDQVHGSAHSADGAFPVRIRRRLRPAALGVQRGVLPTVG